VAKQSTFYLVAAVFAVLLTTLVAFLGGLYLWRSSSSTETGGISAVAGGISSSVFSVLLVAVSILLIILFLGFLKLLKKR
jgi:hypothetical protein